MNKFYEEARQKLRKESSAGKFDRYGSAMKTAVVKALEDFCRQSEVFAEAVAHGRSFEECPPFRRSGRSEKAACHERRQDNHLQGKAGKHERRLFRRRECTGRNGAGTAGKDVRGGLCPIGYLEKGAGGQEVRCER